MSNNKPVISDEAVEAAAKALWQTDQHDDAWVEEYPEYMDYLRAEATKALEAAAPYIAAQAWDAAAASIIDEHGNPIVPTSITNPYRSQG